MIAPNETFTSSFSSYLNAIWRRRILEDIPQLLTYSKQVAKFSSAERIDAVNNFNIDEKQLEVILRNLSNPVRYPSKQNPIAFDEALGTYINQLRMPLNSDQIIRVDQLGTVPRLDTKLTFKNVGNLLEVVFTIYDGLCNYLTNLTKIQPGDSRIVISSNRCQEHLTKIPELIKKIETVIQNVISQIDVDKAKFNLLKLLFMRLFTSPNNGARIRMDQQGFEFAEQAKELGFKKEFTDWIHLQPELKFSFTETIDRTSVNEEYFINKIQDAKDTADKLVKLVMDPKREVPSEGASFLRLKALYKSFNIAPPEERLDPVGVRIQGHRLQVEYLTEKEPLHQLILKIIENKAENEEAKTDLIQSKDAVILTIIRRLRRDRTSHKFDDEALRDVIKKHNLDRIVDYLLTPQRA